MYLVRQGVKGGCLYEGEGSGSLKEHLKSHLLRMYHFNLDFLTRCS